MVPTPFPDNYAPRNSYYVTFELPPSSLAGPARATRRCGRPGVGEPEPATGVR
jgi:hypothetical protein